MAGSIKLLQFFQKFNQTIGIYPRQSNQKQHSINLINTIFLICYAQFMFTTVAFLLFDAKSMFDYGFVFFLIITIFAGIYTHLILIWQSENTLEFIGNCEAFIEKRAYSKIAYSELIGKIELFNKFLCFGIFVTSSLCVGSAAPYSFVRYYIFYMGEDSFYLFAPAWFPFGWKTPFGYLVALLAQYAGCIVLSCTISQFSNLVFGSYWLFIFISEDITQDVAAFNTAAKTTSNENHTKLKKCFCNMVQIYSDANQCVTEFNQLCKYSLFAIISLDMLAVSGLLATIQFDLWADDSSVFEIALLFFILIWIVLFIFLLCEPGARMTNQLEEFSNELKRCDWYLLPMELQRWYIIFVSDTQNPIKVICYAQITFERETSKKIINKAFSYFMTLRKFKS